MNAWITHWSTLAGETRVVAETPAGRVLTTAARIPTDTRCVMVAATTKTTLTENAFPELYKLRTLMDSPDLRFRNTSLPHRDQVTGKQLALLVRRRQALIAERFSKKGDVGYQTPVSIFGRPDRTKKVPPTATSMVKELGLDQEALQRDVDAYQHLYSEPLPVKKPRPQPYYV